MVIVYELKTGFTKRYADMLAAKTRLKVFWVKEHQRLIKTKKSFFSAG